MLILEIKLNNLHHLLVLFFNEHDQHKVEPLFPMNCQKSKKLSGVLYTFLVNDHLQNRQSIKV